MRSGQTFLDAHSKMNDFTGDRLETFQFLRSIRRQLGKATFESAVADLRREEAVARREAAREATIAARLAARKARETARAEIKAKLAAVAAEHKAKEAAKKISKKTFAVHIHLKFYIRKKREDGTMTAPYWLPPRDAFFEARGPQIAKEAQKRFDAELERMEAESPFVVLEESTWVEVSRVEKAKTAVAKTAVKMKQAGSLFLDGEEQHDFDTGAGVCVFDWIRKRYGGVRGCMKIATMESLTEILGEEAIERGVSATDLDRVCDALRCRQYALDETNEIIHTYTPTKLNNNVPPLVYRVKNNHFYPIVKEASSICQLGRATNQAQAKKEAKEEEKEALEIVVLPESDESKIAQVVRICREAETEVYGRGSVPLNYSDDGLVSFKLGGKLYLWEQDEMIEATRKIYDMNEQTYDGSTIPKMILGQLSYLGLTEKSTLNPHAMSVLAQAKNRVHYGRMAAEQPAEWAADIIKCYSSCLLAPMEDWCVFSATDEWQAWDGELKTGVYFVATDDMRLFHGSNVYSRAIIQKAISAGIPHTVLYQLRPSKVLPSSYFQEMVDGIQTLCKGDISLMKWFFNIFVGMLGKSTHTTVTARMDTDINTVWNEYNADKPGKPFITAHDGYYVYGRQHRMELAEHNLPMWIQILDWSNIKLFDLVQQVEATGGVLVGRKTDCAVFLGGDLVEKLEVGGVRRCEVPVKMSEMKPASWRSLSPACCETDSWIIAPVSSSSQVAEATQALTTHQGALLTGYAGTGKTYLAKQIAENFDGPILRMAPTNKAALNIGGRTIHKELKIDMAGKFNLRGLRQKYASKRVLIIVDEASMIGSDLWRKLVELKKALPQSVWLLLGDEGQCRPVGEENQDFFESSMVRFLASGLRINLTQIQRYDPELAELALQIRMGEEFIKRRGRVMAGRHLCYFNATRKRLNAQLNEKRGVFVAATDDDGTQDAWLYPGCPLIAVRNFSRGGDLYCVNAEQFVVRSVTESKLVVVSQRPEGERLTPDGRTSPAEHVWDLATADFHRWFHLNFASTVHKSQGDTITGPITIWDHDAMDARLLYTAVTRAKKLDQIQFA